MEAEDNVQQNSQELTKKEREAHADEVRNEGVEQTKQNKKDA
jgi:hypothetical protein